MNTEDLSPRARLGYGAAGLAVIVGVVLLVVVGVSPFHSGSTYYTASFGRAGQGLDKQSDVKVRGIAVGGVESVVLDAAGKATVRFRIDNGLRIPADAVASIEPVSVFGPKDLDLDLGAGAGPYLADGGVVRQTKDPQELSDTAWPLYKLTKAIDPTEIAGLLHTLAQGLQGEGPALHRTIANGGTLVDLADNRRTAIKQAITDVNLLADTFGSRGGTLLQLTTDANTLGPVLTDRPDKITQLLDGANRLSTGLNGDLTYYGNRLGPLIDATGRTVTTLYQGRANVPPLLNGLIGFFGGISNIIRVPGPDGTLLAQVYNYLPLDLCQALVDVCSTPKAGK